MDDAKGGMENALPANPLDIKEQYERQLKIYKRLTAKRCWSYVPEKTASPVARRREMIFRVQKGLSAEGLAVSLVRSATQNGVLQSRKITSQLQPEVCRAGIELIRAD